MADENENTQEENIEENHAPVGVYDTQDQSTDSHCPFINDFHNMQVQIEMLFALVNKLEQRPECSCEDDEMAFDADDQTVTMSGDADMFDA